MLKRYSKPLGNLFDFKQDFFHENDAKLREFTKLASIYCAQPKRESCKNCDGRIGFSEEESFSKLGVEYSFCTHCGPLNGAHADTDAFCSALYVDDSGKKYAETYLAADRDEYLKRVDEIFVPKAQFVRDALLEAGEQTGRLVDFGVGAGHFVAAARSTGFKDAIGYEPSSTLVDFEKADAQVASSIFVLEHVPSPRSVLQALSRNKNIEYVYFSVPIFSPTVLLESVFPDVMPRHLIAEHTHMYTERSIRHLCDEFDFCAVGEWWFGLDIGDLQKHLGDAWEVENAQLAAEAVLDEGIPTIGGSSAERFGRGATKHRNTHAAREEIVGLSPRLG